MYEVITETAPVETEANYIEGIVASVVEKALPAVVEKSAADVRKRFDYKRPAVPAQPKEDDYNLNEWICAVAQTTYQDYRREKAFNLLNNKYGQDKLQERHKAQTQGTGTAGGFLVPAIYERELLRVEDGLSSNLVNWVRKVPMETNQTYFPVKDQTVTPSSGSNAFNGGFSIGAVTEANAPGAAAAIAFKQLSLTAIKFLAYTQCSTESVDNSDPAIQTIVGEGLVQTVNDYIEYQIINGSSFTGIVGHASAIKQIRATASRVKLVDLAKMKSRFVGKRPIWVFNKSVEPELLQLEDANGNNVWLTNQNVQGAGAGMLYNIPYVFSQYNPTLGNEGDVMLIDGDSYILGENKTPVLEASRDFAFTSDLVTLRLGWRGIGKPMIVGPIKLADGTYTVSPFVVLDNELS